MVWIPDADARSGTDSCTKSGSADDTQDEKVPWSREHLLFLKDTWQFLSNSPDIKIFPEHEIYAVLHAAKTPNIAKLVTGGDMESGKMKTQEMAGVLKTHLVWLVAYISTTLFWSSSTVVYFSDYTIVFYRYVFSLLIQ